MRILIKNFFGLGSITAINKIVALVLTTQIIRTVGDEQYGIYTYLLNIANFLAMVVLLGFPQLITREVASFRASYKPELVVGILRFAILVVGVATIVVSLVAALILLLSHPSEGNIYYPAVWVAILSFITVVIAGIQQALLRGLHYVISAVWPVFILQPSIMIFLILLFRYVEWRITAFEILAFFSAGNLVACTLMIMLIRDVLLVKEQINLISPSYRISYWVRSLVPFFLLGGLAMLMQRSDLLILGIFHPPTDIAIYSIAVQVAFMAQIPTMILNSTIEPQIAVAYTNRESEELEKLHALSSLLTGLSAITAFAIILVFGRWFLMTIFGSTYGESYSSLLIISAGYVFGAVIGPSGSFLSMTGKEKITLFTMAGSVALNICGNFLLIPYMGLQGAAIATLVSLVVAKIAMAVMVWRELGIVPGPWRLLYP